MVAIRCADKPPRSPTPSASKLLEHLQGRGYYSFSSHEKL